MPNTNKQTLILVDDNNNFLGYAPRIDCHTGKGKRHRAFVTLLFDYENNVILQKRRHKLFDGLWDLTAISHPIHINGKDETFQKASDRALNKEMGINKVVIKNVGSFNYFAKDGDNCENEHCAILVGIYHGEVKPDKKEVYEIKRLEFEEFINDVKQNPRKYTPWAKLAVQKMENNSKFDFKRFTKNS